MSKYFAFPIRISNSRNNNSGGKNSVSNMMFEWRETKCSIFLLLHFPFFALKFFVSGRQKKRFRVGETGTGFELRDQVRRATNVEGEKKVQTGRRVRICGKLICVSVCFFCYVILALVYCIITSPSWGCCPWRSCSRGPTTRSWKRKKGNIKKLHPAHRFAHVRKIKLFLKKGS